LVLPQYNRGMIKAIIFDCFGVLTTDGWLPFKRKHFGDNPTLFDEATELNRQANTRLISYNQFINEIAGMAGIAPAQAQSDIEKADGGANEELFDYISVLKRKFKIGMLSNTSKNVINQLFTSNEVGLFDVIVLSYEEGVVKPDRQAYQIVSDRLDVKPEEAIFIDDQERHYLGAIAAGMQAIWYKDFSQMKTELEGILAAVSDN